MERTVPTIRQQTSKKKKRERKIIVENAKLIGKSVSLLPEIS